MTAPPIPHASDPIPRLTSPDGSVVVCFTDSEMRMSVFVYAPVVYRARDAACVLTFDRTLLDGAVGTTFPAPGQVRFALRRYPDGGTVRYHLVVDVEAETFGVGEDAVPDRPLAEIADAIPELRDPWK